VRLRNRIGLLFALGSALALPVAGLTGTDAQAAAGSRDHAGLPRRVYAPYYETYLAPDTPSISTIAKRSGASYFTLAFLQAPRKGSCALDWNGSRSQPLRYYASDIARLRSMGGDVIPSFGGYSADHDGTEIADSCASVARIAADYENVIRTMHVTRLDMDIEDNSLTNQAGIDRRDKAIGMAESWAAHHHIRLQVQFTVPVEPSGLDSTTMRVLRNAIANGAIVSSLNIMVFDYYLSSDEPTLNMGAEAVSAARHVHRQLASLYPRASSARLWAMLGMTMLPGIDDYTPAREVTHLSDAARMLRFARRHGMSFLSIWAIQRDDGRCPGAFDSNTCSGIRQRSWAFSHLLEPFTR
jgi:hypothetical protein